MPRASFCVAGVFFIAIPSLADRDQNRPSFATHIGLDVPVKESHAADSLHSTRLEERFTGQAISLTEASRTQETTLASNGVAKRSDYEILGSGHFVSHKKPASPQDAPSRPTPALNNGAAKPAVVLTVEQPHEQAHLAASGLSKTVTEKPTLEASHSESSAQTPLEVAETQISAKQLEALTIVAKDEILSEKGDSLIGDGLSTMSSVLTNPRGFFLQLPNMKQWVLELKRAVEAQPQDDRGMCLSHGEFKGFGCLKADTKTANICKCRGYIEMCIAEDDETKIAALFANGDKGQALTLAKGMLLGECQTPTWVYVLIFAVACVACSVAGFFLMGTFLRRSSRKAAAAKPSALPNPPKSLEAKKQLSYWQQLAVAGTDRIADAWNSTVDAVRSYILSKNGCGCIYTAVD